ncbi:MAG: hypothetical protein U1F23_04865 [Lysobacterales bacterium]
MIRDHHWSTSRPCASENGPRATTSCSQDGFDGTSAEPGVSTYDDLAEGFLGTDYTYNGIYYHDANGIGGIFPDGSTFTADDVGDQFIIEDAGVLWNDFPDFGSFPNVLTFGTAYVPGDNFSIGALVQASMDLPEPANAVSMDLAFYENGPWGGIELHLDAFLGDTLVGSDSLTIANGGGRDDVTTTTFSVAGVTFDKLRLYATYGGQPSAPRVMIDDLTLTPAAAPEVPARAGWLQQSRGRPAPWLGFRSTGGPRGSPQDWLRTDGSNPFSKMMSSTAGRTPR